MTQFDSPEEWAEALDSNLLHCRELGHSWTSYTARYDSQARTYDRTLVCASCGTERRQVLDSTGEVVRNGYTYVEGYLAKGQMGHVGHKVPRSTFRLAALQRAVKVTPINRRRRKAS